GGAPVCGPRAGVIWRGPAQYRVGPNRRIATMPAKTLLTSFAFVSAMVLGGPAQAGPAISPDPEIATAKVSLADLDLRSEAGAAAGLRRIEMASEKVCGGRPAVAPLQGA